MVVKEMALFRRSLARQIREAVTPALPSQLDHLLRGLILLVSVMLSLSLEAAQIGDEAAVSGNVVPGQIRDYAALEAEALNIDSQVRRSLSNEAQQLGLVNVFIIDAAGKQDLQSVSLIVDEAQPLTYNYSYLETDALNGGAVHHVAVLSLAPGSHRIRATLTSVEKIDNPNVSRTPTRLDGRIEIVEGSQEIAVKLVDESRLGLFYSTEVQLSPLLDKDLWARSADFWLASGRHFAHLSDRGFAGEGEQRGEVPVSFSSPPVEGYAVLEKYNAAVAELMSANAAAMKQFLNGDYTDEAEFMLRDKGSLLLAYFYLSRGKNESAARYFSQVRRHSPFANRALIGLGWSRLNPADVSDSGRVENPYRDANEAAYLWSDSEDFIAWARRQSPFRNAWSVVSARKSQDLINAMTPWMELVGGDPFDPAVQEAMLIVPYTLLHLGASDQAVKRYRNAGRQLTDTAGELRSAIQRVQSGKMTEELQSLLVRNDSGWVQWLCGVDENDVEAYIVRLLEDGNFLMAVDGLRKIVDIRKVLTLRRAQLQIAISAHTAAETVSEIDSLLAQLDQHFSRQANIAEAYASEYLQGELERTESYLAEAHFALARLAEKRFGNLSEVSL